MHSVRVARVPGYRLRPQGASAATAEADGLFSAVAQCVEGAAVEAVAALVAETEADRDNDGNSEK